MPNPDSSSFSRRKWLGLTPTIAAASFGTGLLAARAMADGQMPAANPDSKPSKDNLLGGKIYNIRDFGAVGDGTTLNTKAVQAAVDACFGDGGGTVLVPAGVYQIGMIELKSNVTLHISAGATLLGTGDGTQYHNVDTVPLEGDSTSEDGDVGLIYAGKANNVTVEGPGTIDGQGTLFQHKRDDPNPPPSGISGSHRPYHLMFYQCTNLRVRDIFLKDCAFHSIRVFQCNYAWFDGINMNSRVNSNNDGFHFISCTHVFISNCSIKCQDDACALFGSCQNITVTNCEFSTRWSVFRFGGGHAKDITVSNCLIYETFGCPIKLHCSPRSRFERMNFSNIVMHNVTGPISIGLGPGYRRRQPQAGGGTNSVASATSGTNVISSASAGTNSIANTQTNLPGGFVPAPTAEDLALTQGICRQISFNNIHAVVCKPYPLPESLWSSNYQPGEVFSCIGLNAVGNGFIEDVSFNDVHIIFPGGGTAAQAAVRDVPKTIGEYYAAGVFPSYALYARQVHGLTLNNVRFEIAASDLRPALVFDHVTDAAINGLNVQGDKGAESVLRVIDSQDVLMSATRVLKEGKVFLQMEGSKNENILVDGGDWSKAETPLAFRGGAPKKSVKLRT
jgi:hypothetical protein